MKNDKTGGAAFPLESDYGSQSGMTLRDYFAGQWICGNFERFTPNTRVFAILDEDAKMAYRFADAMIEARKGGE